jgi:integrase/recombinase XerD
MHTPTSQPTIFLNSLEHEGKQYIRIWHKPNPFTVKRLEKSSWIKFNKTFKCFVMYRSEKCIDLLEPGTDLRYTDLTGSQKQ